MSHTGYNQEDSVLVNKGSIDRGLFMATIYHTEKDEDKNITRDEIRRCKPEPEKTEGLKFGNYDKIDKNGFIPENYEGFKHLGNCHTLKIGSSRHITDEGVNKSIKI